MLVGDVSILVFGIVIVVAVLAYVVARSAVRSGRNRYERQVREFRESGCTCDYTFVEAWGTTDVTRRHDCPVHGKKGTNG
jgi:hypothetical protein